MKWWEGAGGHSELSPAAHTWHNMMFSEAVLNQTTALPCEGLGQQVLQQGGGRLASKPYKALPRH